MKESWETPCLNEIPYALWLRFERGEEDAEFTLLDELMSQEMAKASCGGVVLLAGKGQWTPVLKAAQKEYDRIWAEENTPHHPLHRPRIS